MKDSTAIQIAKNLPGSRIEIKADLNWIIFVGVTGLVAYKLIEYALVRNYKKLNEFLEETKKESETSEE